MLGDREAIATIGVRDIDAAAKFYEGILGLKPVPTKEKGVRDYKSGNSNVLVYTSQFAGTNKATAVTWMVGGDIEKVVDALKAKGITFEHYDFPGVTLKGDVHVFGKLKNAWFKDPDGNILSIVGGG
jgi:catechol 2,3-dioxygenase-like lactoylglutathione lyase family enzyme